MATKSNSSSSETGQISGVAERYALALFELAVSEKKIPAVEKDVQSLSELLNGSEDLSRLIKSPVFSAEDQMAAIGAIMKKAKITGLVANFVQVVASNRRLFVIPEMLTGFRRKLAEHRGEITADVQVAQALSAPQTKELKTVLKGIVGKDVALNVTEDASLLGGMIVKVGSRQIDTSLKTKLSSLKLALKEVG